MKNKILIPIIAVLVTLSAFGQRREAMQERIKAQKVAEMIPSWPGLYLFSYIQDMHPTSASLEGSLYVTISNVKVTYIRDCSIVVLQ